MKNRKYALEGIPKRTVILFGFFILFCAALLFWISGISLRQDYAAAARRQGSYTLEIGQSRGIVYDRNLIPLNQAYRTVAAVSPSPQAQQTLASLLNTPQEKTQAAELMKTGSPFLLQLKGTPSETQELGYGSGVILYRQAYTPSEPLAVHLIGYRDGEGNGVAGLEKSFDEYLSQHSGSLTSTYQVDVYQDAFSGIAPQEEADNYLDPQGVVLTLDAQLQQAAEEVAKEMEYPGVILLMESESGCIRASVSTPDYQLDQLSEAMEDPDSPFLNRVLLPYCLGSPFKLVVAAAALEEGYSLCLPEGSTEQEEEQPDYDALSFTYFCNGSIQVGDQTFSCHNHSGHGQLDLIQALEDSCNPYFIALGQWLGPEAILSMARRMGFGQPTLLAEGLSGLEGQLPSEEVLQSSGQLALFSFGQGALTATPLQVGAMVSAIANGGTSVTPFLVSGYTDETGQVLETLTPRITGQRIMKEETALTLQKAMKLVVSQGSGQYAQAEGISMGGKTGTAQTNQFDQDGEERLEAWFAGFFDTPVTRYTAVILCEGGGQGSLTAAPIFSRLAQEIYAIDHGRFFSSISVP